MNNSPSCSLPVTLFLFAQLAGIAAAQWSEPQWSEPQWGQTPLRLAKSLHEGQRILADGKPIDVTTGHAAPYVMDWDGDGKRDLLVGEFGNGRFKNEELPEGIGKGWIEKGRFANGRVRIYKNYGSNKKPRYKGFTFLQAGGGDATVPIT